MHDARSGGTDSGNGTGGDQRVRAHKEQETAYQLRRVRRKGKTVGHVRQGQAENIQKGEQAPQEGIAPPVPVLGQVQQVT